MRFEEGFALLLATSALAFISAWKKKPQDEIERFRARISWPFWLIGIGRPTPQEREWARVGRKRGEEAPASIAHKVTREQRAIEGTARRIANTKKPER